MSGASSTTISSFPIIIHSLVWSGCILPAGSDKPVPEKAPLRYRGDERGEPGSGTWSDRSSEFGERRGDTQGGWRVGGEFVVAASEVLDEGMSGDDHLCGLVRS